MGLCSAFAFIFLYFCFCFALPLLRSLLYNPVSIPTETTPFQASANRQVNQPEAECEWILPGAPTVLEKPVRLFNFLINHRSLQSLKRPIQTLWFCNFVFAASSNATPLKSAKCPLSDNFGSIKNFRFD